MTGVDNPVRNHSAKSARCPRCGGRGSRHSEARRIVYDYNAATGRLGTVSVTYSKHYCDGCRRHFTISVPGLAGRSCYTAAFRSHAVDMLMRGWTLDRASRLLGVPITTLHDWRAAHGLARMSAL